MKLWKPLFGIGLACAACCALPLLAAGSFTAAGALQLAGAEALAGGALLLAGAVAAVASWRRRRRAAACASGADCACDSTCPRS